MTTHYRPNAKAGEVVIIDYNPQNTWVANKGFIHTDEGINDRLAKQGYKLVRQCSHHGEQWFLAS